MNLSEPATEVIQVSYRTIGGGADQFIFGARDAGAGRRKQDVVRDFDRSEGDKIDLSDIDGNSRAVDNQQLDWIGRNADFTEAGQVRFDSARGRPEVNTDNDARAEMRIVLNGVDAFGAQDLLP
ncbi:M10 family metallopeptidase C-terminal domain-containing protein [Limimaricola cinnabarinus]|uniref:M10 family metallopeptidase C-terminal domain-containing protein n=1 Tax=Limimaricola cinnabarinus TaxID=1125964 RepID=UPI002491FF59|nr:type I secretion C-terminal target domain-containing protein [Limimaricola cinnabarinus]